MILEVQKLTSETGKTKQQLNIITWFLCFVSNFCFHRKREFARILQHRVFFYSWGKKGCYGRKGLTESNDSSGKFSRSVLLLGSPIQWTSFTFSNSVGFIPLSANLISRSASAVLLNIHTSEPGTQEFSKICTNTHQHPHHHVVKIKTLPPALKIKHSFITHQPDILCPCCLVLFAN